MCHFLCVCDIFDSTQLSNAETLSLSHIHTPFPPLFYLFLHTHTYTINYLNMSYSTTRIGPLKLFIHKHTRPSYIILIHICSKIHVYIYIGIFIQIHNPSRTNIRTSTMHYRLISQYFSIFSRFPFELHQKIIVPF